MHPTRQAAEPDRKFPLTDMPTGLMAALVTRLADHLLIRPVVRRAGRSRTSRRRGPRDQVGRIDRAPAGLRGLGAASGLPSRTQVVPPARRPPKVDHLGCLAVCWDTEL